MAFKTEYKDENFGKKHMLKNSIKFLDGVYNTDMTNTWIVGDTSNGITKLSSQFCDVSTRSRYNIEYMGSVSAKNVKEGWKKKMANG